MWGSQSGYSASYGFGVSGMIGVTVGSSTVAVAAAVASVVVTVTVGSSTVDVAVAGMVVAVAGWAAGSDNGELKKS